MSRGDVVLVRFPHPSGVRGKRRPALVVQADSYAAVVGTNGASLNVSFSGCPAKNRLWCPLAAADRAPPISVP